MFYAPEQIALRDFPPVKSQSDIAAQVHKRAATIMKQAQRGTGALAWTEAEQTARQHVEAELLEEMPIIHPVHARAEGGWDG